MQTIRRFVDESVASLSGARVKDFVTSLLRLVIGLLFVGHACQKAFGWFGGDGIQAWMATVQKATFQPAVLGSAPRNRGRDGRRLRGGA